MALGGVEESDRQCFFLILKFHSSSAAGCVGCCGFGLKIEKDCPFIMRFYIRVKLIKNDEMRYELDEIRYEVDEMRYGT